MHWVCTICGYVHDEEDERPDMCPVCGAPGSRFRETSGAGSNPGSDELEQVEGGLDSDSDDDD